MQDPVYIELKLGLKTIYVLKKVSKLLIMTNNIERKVIFDMCILNFKYYFMTKKYKETP